MSSFSAGGIQIISYNEIYEDRGLCSHKLKEAAKQGLFFLELSADDQKLVSLGREFANHFYKDKTLKELKLPGFSGYNERPNDQIESFYAEKKIYKKVLSESVEKVALFMEDLAEKVLVKTRIALGISEDLWRVATSEGKRQCHFSVNHYRTDKKEVEGLKAHKDFGFVTLLDTPQKGLKVFTNKKWVALEPTKQRYIVLFSRALEILVNDTSKVQACLHKVERQTEGERVSVSLALDGQEDGRVYSLSKDGKELEERFPDYTAYIQDCFSKLYDS